MKNFLTMMLFLIQTLLNVDLRAESVLETIQESEKIYAVMITGKDDFHKFLSEKSVQSFLQQTYPNKHLIIVNDGNYSFDQFDNRLITEIKLNKKYVLGALRNIGLKQIPENGIYLQWDDDDWHHPNLMAEQYKYLKSHSADACILKSQVMYCFKINTAWTTSPVTGIIGTIMCRKKSDVNYPKIAKSEDRTFIKDYAKKYKHVIWNNPDFYYLRFIHGHNTWDDKHFKLNTRKTNHWAISQNASCYLSEIVPLYK